MTDARLPERWLHDRRLQRLSDPHFGAYFNALMFAVSNRSDGVIEPEDLGLIPRLAAGAAHAFVDAGLWSPRAQGGWVIADFAATQTSRSDLEVLENARKREREKKSRQRAKAAPEDAVFGDTPGNMSGGQSRGTVPGEGPPGLHRRGKARLGEARTGKEQRVGHFAEPDSPPTVDHCIDCESKPAGEGLRRCLGCERTYQSTMAGYDR